MIALRYIRSVCDKMVSKYDLLLAGLPVISRRSSGQKRTAGIRPAKSAYLRAMPSTRYFFNGTVFPSTSPRVNTTSRSSESIEEYTAFTRETSPSNAIMSRSRSARNDVPVAISMIASSRLVLPAVFGPATSVNRGENTNDFSE